MEVVCITKTDFARKLKEGRKSTGLSQQAVADKIGRPQQTVASWETGKSQPDADTLAQLLRLYDYEPNAFFEFSEADIDSQESHLLSNYRSLNEEGQFKLVDYSDDLVTGGRYKKHDKSILGTKEA